METSATSFFKRLSVKGNPAQGGVATKSLKDEAIQVLVVIPSSSKLTPFKHNPNTIVYKSTLWKRGGGARSKGWKQRYFVLTNQGLLYYYHETGPQWMVRDRRAELFIPILG